MASTSSRIRIIFDGVSDGVTRAAARAAAAVRAFDDAVQRNASGIKRATDAGNKLGSVMLTVAKGFAVAGAGAASIQSVVAILGALATVTAELAPAALAIPGVILAAATAYGVFKLAVSGVGDALKGDAEAFAKLAPAAQSFVTALRSLNPEFSKLRSEVQQRFFAGLAVEVKATGKELLALGRIALPEVADSLNAMAVAALKAARSPFFQDDLAQIFDNTSTGLARMRDAVANLLSGFVGLGAIGSQQFPRLTAAIDRGALAFRRWVDTGAETGSINRLIERSIEAWKTLGRILADVGAGARDLFRAFSEGLSGGSGTLAAIERVTQAFRELAATTEAQNAMRALGETVRVLGDAFRLVLNTAVRELGPVIAELAPFIQELATVLAEKMARAIEFIAPLLKSFARFLSENKEAIAPLVSAILSLVTAFKLIKIATGAISAIRTFGAAVRAFDYARAGRVALAILKFAAPIAVPVGLGLLVKKLDDMNIAAAGGDPAKLEGIAKALHELVTGFEDLAAGDFGKIRADFNADVKRLVDDFNADIARLGNGEAPISEIWRKITDSFQRDLVDVLAEKGKKIGESFRTDFLGFFASLPQLFSDGWEQVKITTETKLAEVGTAISNFFSFDTGVKIGEFFGRLVTEAQLGWEQFKTTTLTKLEEARVAIVNFFTVTVPTALRSFGETLRTKATEAWESFKLETTTKINEIVTFVTELPTRIGDALAALPGILAKKAQEAWDFFFGGTKKGGDTSVTEAGTVPGRTGTATNPIIQILIQKATEAWQGWITAQTARITTILADAKALPGKIVSTIGNLSNTLVAAGNALMDGLLSGIRSAYERVRSFVSGIAAGLAREKGPLPYDRVVMIPAGLALMEGLGVGIERGYAPLLARVGGMAPELAAKVAQGVSVASARVAAFDAAQSQRAASAGTSRALLGDAITSVSAVANREIPAPVIQVDVQLSREQIAELARVEVSNAGRDTARRVAVGVGTSF